MKDPESSSKHECPAQDPSVSLPITAETAMPGSGQLLGAKMPGNDRRRAPLLCESIRAANGSGRAYGLVDFQNGLVRLAEQEYQREPYLLGLICKALQSRLRVSDALMPPFAHRFFVVLPRPLHHVALHGIEERLEAPIEIEIGGHSFFVCANAVFQNSTNETAIEVLDRLEDELVARLADRARSWRPRSCSTG